MTTQPTTHNLLAIATFYQTDTRTSLSLRRHIGTGDDKAIDIYDAGHTIELQHADGRIVVINILDIIAQAEMLFTPPAPAESVETTSQQLALSMERFDMAARSHSWLGSQPPEDHDAIRRGYTDARMRLWLDISRLITQREQLGSLLELGAKTMAAQTDSALSLAEAILDRIDDEAFIAQARQQLIEIKAARQEA